jgi:hypothetical protein
MVVSTFQFHRNKSITKIYYKQKKQVFNVTAAGTTLFELLILQCLLSVAIALALILSAIFPPNTFCVFYYSQINNIKRLASVTVTQCSV